MIVADSSELNLVSPNRRTFRYNKQGNAAWPSRSGIRCLSAAILLVAMGAVASAQPAPRPGPRGPVSLPPALQNLKPKNFYQVIAEKEAQFEVLRNQLREQSLVPEGTGYGRFKDWERDLQGLLYPHGDFLTAHNAMIHVPRAPQPAAALQKSASATASASASSASCSGWTELGPLDMPLGGSPSRGVGRVNWIDFDPNNSDNVFTGSAVGGLFYSTDRGDTWHSGGTDFLSPNIGAAHLAVDPTDHHRWFLATGDGDGLMGNGWGNTVSHGVYRTTDKGLTWKNIGLHHPNWWSFQIKKLLINPNNPMQIFAATSFGLWHTRFAQEDAPEWKLLRTGEESNDYDAFYDIVVQPGSNTIYASRVSLLPGPPVATLLRSFDAGASWSELPGIPFLPDPKVVRIALDVTPANPNYLYVVVVGKQPEACNGVDANGVPNPVPSSRLYRFDANTEAWTDKGPICQTGSTDPDWRGVHPNRAHSIGVSPTNPDRILVADIRPAMCINGGAGFGNTPCNWTQMASASIVHDDIHQMKFTPQGNTIYAATDGGVFRSDDDGVTWAPKNKGLRIATVLRMSTSATDPSLIMTGLFDNGTLLYKNNNWTHVMGGDGLAPIIDHTNPNVMYATAQQGNMQRSDDTGTSFTTKNLPCNTWTTFATLNSVDTQTVFGACAPEVRRSTNKSDSWDQVPISKFAPQGMGGYVAFKLYTAPSNQNYLYAHLVQDDHPQLLMRSTNANATDPADVAWQAIPHPSAQWLSDIDVDEANPDKFWLTYKGAAPADQKVFYYDPDLQNPWVNLTGNLATLSVGDPELSVTSLSLSSIVHERGSRRLFIGTNVGVYTANADSASPTWTRVGAAAAGQMPHVEVRHLEINYVNNKLRAGTYGRGTWEIALDPCLPTVAGPDAIIKDSAADLGNQPNNESGNVLSASQDIWVRNAPDYRFTSSPLPPRFSHEHLHLIPEYSAIAVNTPYIYVKVRNRGSAPVSGKVHFYWTKASTAGTWPNNWTEVVPANPSTADVVNLAPGSAWVAHTQWGAGMPQPAAAGFSLLARFVAAASTPDPGFNELLNGLTFKNVYNSNNMAWKNITIVDDLQN